MASTGDSYSIESSLMREEGSNGVLYSIPKVYSTAGFFSFGGLVSDVGSVERISIGALQVA